jgi:myo-inositol-1(or 4)-monophosphatase
MSEILQTARRAAVAAGEVLLGAQQADLLVERKAEVDLVTDADRAAERAALTLIRQAHPEDEIVAEESGEHAGGSGRRWLVDPLDGTTNFAHGHPHFSVSIAVEERGRLVAGVVHDPLRAETFTAVRGRGASLGECDLRVSATGTLDEALLGTGFPYDRRGHAAAYLVFVERLLARAQGIRRAGSAALDLAYVAAGRLDGFWEWKLAPWDVAAGRLLVEEAGGRVTAADGTEHVLDGSSIVASNGRLHRGLVEALAWDGRLPRALDVSGGV